MKQTFTLLTKTLLLLCVLLAGSARAWGEEVTLTQSSLGLTGSYTTNTEKTIDGITYVYTDLMKNNDNIQAKASTGVLYNKTAYPGNITSVTITHSGTARATTIMGSNDGKNWTDVATGNGSITADFSGNNYTYFKITRGSNAAYWTKVEITYESKFSLDKNSLDFGDVIFGQTKSMTFTVTPANLTGDLTISCDNDKYEVSPATIAKGTTTATIVTVTAKPTAKSDNMVGTVTISEGGKDGKSVALTANVISRESVAPVGPAGGSSYILVTDASTLAEGDVIIIANTNAGKALSATQNSNNRGAVGITVNGDRTIATNGNIQEIVLEGNTDAWYFKVGTDAYLYAASSESNYLRTDSKSTVGNNGKAKITINNETGDALILFQGTNTRNDLRYNSQNSLFSCYSSVSGNQAEPQIYRRNEASSFDLTVGSTGWRTLVASVDATLPAGLKAYTVTASTNEKATLTEVTSVKANTAYLLNGEEGDYTLSVAQTAEEPSGNLLQVSTETTGNGVYVLANNDKGVGFYKWAGGSLGAGRVYLPAPTKGAAREFIEFGISEQTAIKTVAASVLDGQYYDLQGRSVAQPRKGLYIVNGKKVVIK